ncbi:MAG: NAD(P)-dependent glycerol-3-phosphate dehydrogenase [Clostridiales bacterium]|nr:NAD(P)-dependent glycerol-3-phosphate dehydrogenase [Clostridiales bacterium]
MAQVGIIGAGSWGTALAVVLAHNGHEVTVWSIIEDEVRMLAAQREHKEKLPGVKIPESVAFTTDMEQTVVNKAMVVLAVPSPYIRSTAHSMAEFVGDSQLLVVVSKGIEEETLMIQTDIVEQEIPQARVAVLSGPSHAEEVGRELPTTVVAGAKTKAIAERVQALFMNEVFRVYTSPDMLGIELGSSLKNVIALAAGMADGLGFGDNTKAALITRGIAEIGRLASAMGASMETVNGLSGIGDLIVTCASRHSRNRKAGMLIGQGYTMREAMDEVKMVVEGVYSAKAALALSKKYEVDMPIVEQVNRVLFEGQPAKDAVLELMLRERKPENEDLDW